MLPRVGQALTNFLTPLVSSKEKPKEDSKKDSSQNEGKKDHEELREALKTVVPEEEKPKEEPVVPSVGIRMLEIFSSVQPDAIKMKNSKGKDTYWKTAQNKKKSSKVRKGTMFDENIE